MEILKKCRVCLKEKQKVAVSLIKEAPVHKLSLSEIYQYVTGFQMVSGPQVICPGCSKDLNAAFFFKRRCEENEKMFEKLSVDVKEELSEMEVDVKMLQENLVFVPGIEENFCDFDKDSPKNEENVSDKDIQQRPWNLKCSFCAKTFENETSMMKHCHKKHREDMFPCIYCQKVCKTYQSCLQHCVVQHPEKQLKCPKPNCSYLYYMSIQLEKHLEKVHASVRNLKEQKSHKCSNCDESFEKESHLRKHRLNVHGIKANSITDQSKEKTLCPHCGKTLKFSSLASHIEMIHKKSDAGVYICDFCGNNYNSKMSIANHLRYLHMKKGPIVCRYCVETFANDGSRRYHEVTVHTKDYKHMCSICGMKCYNSAIYKRHMISHTGEKPYMCPQCGARFGRKNTLNNHIATHTDIKGFICKICNAAFKTIKSLKTHQNVHQERKYECPVCNQSFLVNQSMRIHCTKTHPDYKLPPPGTVMNKQALKRMHELSLKRPQNTTVTSNS